jgi:hypothetical protein
MAPDGPEITVGPSACIPVPVGSDPAEITLIHAHVSELTQAVPADYAWAAAGLAGPLTLGLTPAKRAHRIIATDSASRVYGVGRT